MFLRRDKKQGGGVISRPSNGQKRDGGEEKNTIKALAGFDDEVETSHETRRGEGRQIENGVFFDEGGHEDKIEDEVKGNGEILYTYEELSEMDNLQYEVRLVEEILLPGGIKVKPNESLLRQFSQAAKTLNKDIIGSLLISRLQDGFPYQIKSKSLYTISYLSKTLPIYKHYFQQFIAQINSQPPPPDNTLAYQNLLKQILSSLENTTVENNNENEINIFEFDGPNYNNDLPNTKKQIGKMRRKQEIGKKGQEEEGKKIVAKKFISPQDAKKIQEKNDKREACLIDLKPGNNKIIVSDPSKQEFNIFDLDFSAPKDQPCPSRPQVIQIPIPALANPQLSQPPPHQPQHFLYHNHQLQHQMYLQRPPHVITGADLYSLSK